MYERIYYAMISAALASSPDVPGEWERLLTQVIPYRLKLIERGECVDASVEAIRECVARLLASAPAQPTVPDKDRYFPFEFEVWQGDVMCASTSGPREMALAEVMRYAAQYEQDGPVKVFEVRRELIAAAAPVAMAAQPTPEHGGGV